MSQYYRTFVLSSVSKNSVEEHDRQLELKDDLVTDVVRVLDDVDEDEFETVYDMSVSSITNRITVRKGFKAEHPFPSFMIYILGVLGIKLDPNISIILAALYEESGFNEFSREDCDCMYLNTILRGVKNRFSRFILKEILLMLIGNNYVWNSSSDQITVATMEPIWN